MSKTVQIGLFCGTFNPIHNAHLLLAQCACEQFQLHKIYFVTSPRPPHRHEDLMPASLRHRMVLLALADNENFIPSSAEVERTGPSYTIDTINYFQSSLQQNTGDTVKINLLLGGDNVIHLPTWHKFDEITAKARLLIAPRWADHIRTPTKAGQYDTSFFTDEEQTILNKTDYGLIEFPLIDISSTYIRQCLKEGKSIRYLVPETVWQLLVKENIFRT